MGLILSTHGFMFCQSVYLMFYVLLARALTFNVFSACAFDVLCSVNRWVCIVLLTHRFDISFLFSTRFNILYYQPMSHQV